MAIGLTEEGQHNGSIINDLVAMVDSLTYRSYARNRRLSPDVTPERWAAIYPDAELFERQWFKAGDL